MTTISKRCDLPSLPTWHVAPVCLIGDAAHAMLPSAGQGASMAIEDAIVLARCLRDRPDIEAAFAAFEAVRKGQIEQLAAEARGNAGRKAPTNLLTRGIRDLLLPIFIRCGADSMARIYAHRVDWATPALEPVAAGA